MAKTKARERKAKARKAKKVQQREHLRQRHGKGGRDVRMGNPAQLVEQDARRKQRLSVLREPAVQKIREKLNNLLLDAPSEDGLVADLLRFAAEYYADVLVADSGLQAEEHETSIAEFLIGAWGEVVHSFPDGRLIVPYSMWRAETRARLEEAAEPGTLAESPPVFEPLGEPPENYPRVALLAEQGWHIQHSDPKRGLEVQVQGAKRGLEVTVGKRGGVTIEGKRVKVGDRGDGWRVVAIERDG